MPMMTMMILLVCVYFACLIAILFFYKRMNQKIVIKVFAFTDLALFIAYIINDCYRFGSFQFISLDQISPFMFTIVPLVLVTKNKAKDIIMNTVSLLSLGMLVAMLVSPMEAFLGSYRKEASLLYWLDTLLHLNCSLFGTYLFISGMVKLKYKSLFKGAGLLYSVIILGVMLNFIHHKNYFGMGYYSNYGIYMIRIFETYWASLAAYLLGVALVLMLGFEYGLLLTKLNKANSSKEEVNGDGQQIIK